MTAKVRQYEYWRIGRIMYPLLASDIRLTYDKAAWSTVEPVIPRNGMAEMFIFFYN